MGYATLMVSLHIGQPNDAVLDVARAVARIGNSAVLGVAVAQKTKSLHEEDYVFLASVIEKRLPAVLAQIAATEAEFRAAQLAGETEWRLGETYHTVTDYLAAEARGADLVVVSAGQPVKSPTLVERFDLADFVTLAGRPVLAVPNAPRKTPGFARAMVMWKDLVETRRAVVGALPLLRQASYVSLVQSASHDEMAAERELMHLVVQWFKRHGVTVDPMVLDSKGDDAARLRAAVLEQDPDFVVAGAYSHSRLRERVFGGVTRDMLLQIDRCVLLAH
jgi:nucleotide-binding universal stress UspA family protein